MDKTNWHRPNEEMHGKQTSCPKCELEFKTMLHPFCQHHECPVRDWGRSQQPPTQPDTRPNLLERLRTEADLCRNETADDVAALLDEAADYIQRHNDKVSGGGRRPPETESGGPASALTELLGAWRRHGN